MTADSSESAVRERAGWAPGAPAVLHPAVEVSTRARVEILFAVLLGLFLAALDQTIVGPVLPRIVTDLRGVALYPWVVTAYLLTSTATVPIYGKLSDLYGRKPMLLFGVALFLTGSALSGLSQTMWQLIVFRALQGLGGGALFPIALAVIGDLFTPAERGRYQALFGAVFGIAFLAGPFIGGFLTDTFSWHWIFFVNLPIGFVTLYIIGRLLPSTRAARSGSAVDLLGAATLTLALVPALVALTLAQRGTWSDRGVVLGFAAAGIFGLLFLFVERRAADPIIPLSLFRNRVFTVSVVGTFLGSFGFATAIIFLPLWYQVVRGATSTQAGYSLLPLLFGLIGSSIAAGQVISRTGRYKWLVVGAMVMIGLGLFLFTHLRPETPSGIIGLWMVAVGVGVGPMMAAYTPVVQNAVPFARMGTATSDLTLARQIGMSVGITIAFTVFRLTLTWDLLRASIIGAGAPAGFVPIAPPAGFDLGRLTSIGGGGGLQQMLAGVPAAWHGLVLRGFHEAFSTALARSMWVGIAAAAVGFLAALFLPELPLRRSRPRAEEVSG